MNQRNLRNAGLVLLFVATMAGPVRAQDIRLNILKPDDLVLRGMVVFKKSGERVNSFVKIDTFEPASGVFVMEDATGQMLSVPASEIQKIEFEQMVRRQSPVAQEAYWEIRATVGSGLRYKVPQGALRLESGELVLPASAPSTSAPGPAEPSPEPAPRNPGDRVTTLKMVEAKSLTVDGASKSFFIDVQNLTYTKETSGSPGLSGMRK